MFPLNDTAQLALGLMDLTRLEEGDDRAQIRALCRRAVTPFGSPAAVCVLAEFVPAAREELARQGLGGSVSVATVVNFPGGDSDPAAVAKETQRAIALGADEIDVVFPWRALKRSCDEASGRALVAACREAAGDHLLKVILETGELADPALMRRAAEIAVDAGADFLKTSTGKVPVNATPEAARILLEVIRDSEKEVGCKVSGGIRTTGQAIDYLKLAAEIMGHQWIAPGHFRFGASGLLDDLLATLEGSERPGRQADTY